MFSISRLAAAVWIPIGVFAIVNRAFERRVLEPMVGGEVAAVLASATLAGVVFAVALLWLGDRTRPMSFVHTAVVSGTWGGEAALLSLLATAAPFFADWRQPIVLFVSSAAAPWFVRGLQPARRRLSGAG